MLKMQIAHPTLSSCCLISFLLISDVCLSAPVIYDSLTTFQGDLLATGITASQDNLDGMSVVDGVVLRADFEISFQAGFEGIAENYFGINKDGFGLGSNGDPSGGVSFDFGSNINAFGLTIDGWGNCCGGPPYNLFMNTDDGPFMVARTTNFDRGAPPIFVGLIDTNTSFHNIHIFGDSSGDSMIVGMVHYAASPVPLPPAAFLFGSALIGLIGIRKRKSARSQL